MLEKNWDKLKAPPLDEIDFFWFMLLNGVIRAALKPELVSSFLSSLGGLQIIEVKIES